MSTYTSVSFMPDGDTLPTRSRLERYDDGATIPVLYLASLSVNLSGHPDPAAYLRALAAEATTLADEVEVEQMRQEREVFVSTYTCTQRGCGAQFGIAGVSSGTEDDRAADDYHREQIEWHESGQCVAVRQPGEVSS